VFCGRCLPFRSLTYVHTAVAVVARARSRQSRLLRLVPSQWPLPRVLPLHPSTLVGLPTTTLASAAAPFYPRQPRCQQGALKTCLPALSLPPRPHLSFKRHSAQRARRADFTRGTVSPLSAAPTRFARACYRSQVRPGKLTQVTALTFTLVDRSADSRPPQNPSSFVDCDRDV
jgi:hypothetical protein